MAIVDDGPELPAELQYLWNYFCDLMMAVMPGGFGPPAATWENIHSWSLLMRNVLEPWEARMLARLSVIRANVLAAEDKTKPANGKKK